MHSILITFLICLTAVFSINLPSSGPEIYHSVSATSEGGRDGDGGGGDRGGENDDGDDGSDNDGSDRESDTDTDTDRDTDTDTDTDRDADTDGINTTPSPIPTPTPTPSTPKVYQNFYPTQITEANKNGAIEWSINNFDWNASPSATKDCAPLSGTIMMGPSTMEDGGARVLGFFDQCVLSDGSVTLNLSEEEGLQLVAASTNTQGPTGLNDRPASISVRYSPYKTVELSEQITGQDPTTGEQVTLNGNINALFLWNNAGQAIEFSADDNVAINANLRR
jgi:hypothetical protein